MSPIFDEEPFLIHLEDWDGYLPHRCLVTAMQPALAGSIRRSCVPRKGNLSIFLQDGTNDIVNQFGSWPEANKAMDAALRDKGYDVKFVLGEGSHSSRHGASILPDALRWLWRDYPK